MYEMLDEVCGYINNFFVTKPNGKHRGKFAIENGSLSVDFLQENQYFRIVGSTFNDGVYKFPANGLINETFVGEVWAMAVPPAVIALIKDISDWNEKYGTINSVNMSPFTSESFNNYSYTKGTSNRNAGSGGSNSTPISWREMFGDRLNRWRKLS